MGLSASAPWTKYYGDTPVSLNYPKLTMYQLLRQTARQYPDAIAYDFKGKKCTFKAFLESIDDAAKGLTAMGITRGDKVTICMPNSPQALACFYGLNRIGAIPSMIHPLSAPQESTATTSALYVPAAVISSGKVSVFAIEEASEWR